MRVWTCEGEQSGGVRETEQNTVGGAGSRCQRATAGMAAGRALFRTTAATNSVQIPHSVQTHTLVRTAFTIALRPTLSPELYGRRTRFTENGARLASDTRRASLLSSTSDREVRMKMKISQNEEKTRNQLLAEELFKKHK
jgi:hypothetical protein